MSLETRVSLLARAIGQKIKQLVTDISGKVSVEGNTEDGYLKTDSSGTVVVDTTSLAPTTPTDGVEYVMKDGIWIQLVKTATLDWTSGITDKPVTFPPDAHTHGDIYYTETELDALLGDKSDSTHVHGDIYYTETEIDGFLTNKEDSFIHSTGFNKDFGSVSGTVSEGDHNHNTVYYTKTEVSTLISNLGNSGHNHNDTYYTKVQVDTLLQEDLSSTHNHDDIYYTETEIDSLLTSKADISHTHDDRYYTETELDILLAAKAALSHTHDERYFTETEVTDFLSNKSDLNHHHDERYFTEDEITFKLKALEENLEEQIYFESSFTPEEGIEVILKSGGRFGKYSNGDTIPGNISVLQVIKDAVTEYEAAVFRIPSVDLSSSIDSLTLWEVGESVDLDFTSSYTPYDAGAATNYEILKDGVQIYTSPSVPTYTDSGVIIALGGNVYSSIVDHAEGTVPNQNSLGVDEANTISAGSLTTNTLTFKGYMPIFSKPVATAYTTGADIRANLDKTLKTDSLLDFILESGTTHNVFQFWVPDTITVTAVLDLQVFGHNIISDYVQTTLDVPDASGTLISGKLYTATFDVPYSTNHSHKITLS
jgi:hypothetical protein